MADSADSQGITITTTTTTSAGTGISCPSSPSSPPQPLESARSPMLRARPRLPAGPRTRKQTAFAQRSSLEDTSRDCDLSLLQDHDPPSDPAPAWTVTAHGSDIHLSDPFSPSPSSDPLSSIPLPQPALDRQTESPVDPRQPLPPHSSASPSPDISQTPLLLSHSHLPLQDHPMTSQLSPAPETSLSGTPTLFPSPMTSPVPRKPSQATVSSTAVPLIALPAAQMNLTPDPLPYTFLTLDTAHWTLTSSELQSLVSSAIRDSAKEQFIRLLPLTVIDTQMPEDAARIEHSWDTAATRWRFEAHRRNMLLRALAASGADSDLLGQLSSTLSNLDSHAQDLLHSAVHRTQLTTARDTHRASALAVALRKLNASYARRTRDLDKARSQIAALRGDVDEAWKVAVEQAAQLGKLKAVAPEQHEKLSTSLGDSVIDDGHPDEDDASGSIVQDGASIDLTMLSRAELVDVTGKAVAAQARLTMMRTEHSSSSSAPTSAFSSPLHSSPMTPGTNTPLDRQLSIASQVSRVTAARKRSRRRSKASLRPPASVSVRPHSTTRKESSARRARTKSHSKKGKEPVRAGHSFPRQPADMQGSFLEMEGRPAGDEGGVEDRSDGDRNTSVGGKLSLDDSKTTGPTAHAPPQTPALTSEEQALPTPIPSQSPRDGYTPPTANAPSAPRSASDASTPSIYPSTPLPSTTSMPTLPPSTEPPIPPLNRRPSTDGADTSKKVVCAAVSIPDPASIFSVAAASSAPELAQHGNSLDSSSLSAGSSKYVNHAGEKIRRSLTGLFHFGDGSRTRRRSMPFAFKVRGAAVDSKISANPLPPDLRDESHQGEGSEDGWEDTREDDG